MMVSQKRSKVSEAELVAASPLARASIVPVRPGDEVVAIIMRLMVNHSYDGDTTIRELAAERGLSEHTVRRYTDEAARFIRLCSDPESVRRWGLYTLNRIVEETGVDADGRPLVPAAAKVTAIKVALDAVTPRDPSLGKPGYGGAPELPREERIRRLTELLASPDSELSEALRGASESVRKVIDEK